MLEYANGDDYQSLLTVETEIHDGSRSSRLHTPTNTDIIVAICAIVQNNRLSIDDIQHNLNKNVNRSSIERIICDELHYCKVEPNSGSFDLHIWSLHLSTSFYSAPIAYLFRSPLSILLQICARWISRLLSDDHKKTRAEC